MPQKHLPTLTVSAHNQCFVMIHLNAKPISRLPRHSSQRSSSHQGNTEVEQAPKLLPRSEASRPKKVNHCSVAKRSHVFDLLQEKKFNQKPDRES